jgi:hypothetical protein
MSRWDPKSSPSALEVENHTALRLWTAPSDSVEVLGKIGESSRHCCQTNCNRLLLTKDKLVAMLLCGYDGDFMVSGGGGGGGNFFQWWFEKVIAQKLS